MKTKLFIFDLDGVIVDTAKYHFLAWQKIAQNLGIEFNKEDNEKLKGVSRIQSLEIILSLRGIQISQTKKEQLLEQKNQDYLSYIVSMNDSELLPNILKTLQFLKNNNQLIALGSASKNARPILEKTGIISLFDAIIDGNDVTNAKPDPEVFLAAAQKLNVHPNDAIVFEDAVAGIQAANSAGMYSIGIGDKTVLSQAKSVFENFNQISDSFLISLTK